MRYTIKNNAGSIIDTIDADDMTTLVAGMNALRVYTNCGARSVFIGKVDSPTAFQLELRAGRYADGDLYAVLDVTGTTDRIEGGAFIGPKAVDVFRMITLVSALKGWDKGIRFRGVTAGRMADMVEGYTGKRFPKSPAGRVQAIAAMQEAIPAARAQVG